MTILKKDSVVDEAPLVANNKERTWLGYGLTWVIRLLILGIILSLVTLFLLSRITEHTDGLKEGLEATVTENTDYQLQIGSVHTLRLLPDVKLDVRGITVYRKETREKVFSLGAAYIHMSLTDLILSKREVKGLYLDEVEVLIGEDMLRMDEAYLGDALDAPHNSYDKSFKGHFSYRGEEFTAQVGITENAGVYDFIKPQHVDLFWDDLTLSFDHDSSPEEGRHVSNIGLFQQGSSEASLRGDVTMRAGAIHATLHSGPVDTQSTFQTELKIGSALSGQVVLKDIDVLQVSALIERFSKFGQQGVSDEVERPVPTAPATPIEIDLDPINLDFNITGLKAGNVTIGDLRFPLVGQKDLLQISQLSGKILGGDVSGKVTLGRQEVKDDYHLSSALRLDGLEYHKLRPEIKNGQASLDLVLESRSKTYEGLAAGLDGQIKLIGGQADMPVSAFNIWGGGLLNAIVPSLDKDEDTQMNCAIAEFDVKEGVAQSRALFLDTQRVTVVGEGTIDLGNNEIDLTLSPASKNTALLQIDTDVDISGELTNPDIGANGVSLGLTGLKALAGVINPALLLVTMTDLGVSEDHPCHKYVTSADVDRDIVEPQDVPTEAIEEVIAPVEAEQDLTKDSATTIELNE